MLQIKVGIRLASLRLPFRQALAKAKELGAEAVEIDARSELRPEDLSHTGVRQVRKILEDLALKVSAVSFHTRRGYDVLEDLEPRIDATKRTLQLAYDLGAGVVVNHIGRVPDQLDSPDAATLLQALADIGQHGQRVGALLAAETGTESGAQLAQLIARLPPGSIGVDLNPANLIVHGHEPREAARALGEHILHVHATDATRDVARKSGLEVPLGQGSAEWPELLGILEEQQYRGYFTVARNAGGNALADIRQAVNFVRNI
ncbi:MAG TPA: sugar phosphate isomerase/epimerase family protein [Pirellulaceae bacterium]|nr:sugar phosphate isomerase/epimerase family protein [Pirellulaceae bacterium]